MKKLYILSFVLLTSLSFGQVVLNESFDYTTPGFIGGNTTTPTDATGSNNWLTHSNTSTVANVGLPGTIDVLSGSLTYSGLATSTGNKVYLSGNNSTVSRDVNRAITTSATVLYYSALINVTDNTQLSTTISGNNSYFLALAATSGTAVTTLGARLAALSSNGGSNYTLNIQNNNGGSNTVYTANPGDLNFGTTYLVVVKFDLTTTPSTATLWVNPTSLGGAEPASTITSNLGTTTFATLGSIAIRNASGTPKVEIDEIRVGETWASVTPTNLSVNQNAIAGLDIYPNPVTNGVLNINTTANDAKNVVVYDVLGKQVVNTTISGSTVNVANLKNGVYIVKITENGKTATRKLVIR